MDILSKQILEIMAAWPSNDAKNEFDDEQERRAFSTALRNLQDRCAQLHEELSGPVPESMPE